MSRSQQQGLGLIEVLVYISLFAMLSVMLTRFAAEIIQRNSHTQLMAQALDNARGAMALLSYEIRHASGVYTPTSTLGSHPGQLSLATTENLPAEETETYVDFYLDDNRLYMKREGVAAQLITSQQVEVSDFVVTYLHQSSAVPAVQVTLTVRPSGASSAAIAQSAVRLSSTASLRSY